MDLGSLTKYCVSIAKLCTFLISTIKFVGHFLKVAGYGELNQQMTWYAQKLEICGSVFEFFGSMFKAFDDYTSDGFND